MRSKADRADALLMLIDGWQAGGPRVLWSAPLQPAVCAALRRCGAEYLNEASVSRSHSGEERHADH